MKKLTNIIGIGIVLMMLVLGLRLAFASNPTIEAVNTLSKNWIETQKTIEKACDRIDERRQEGRRGNKTEYYNSLKWFESEYNADYDYACMTNPEEPRVAVVHHTAIDYESQPEQLQLVQRQHKRDGYSTSCFGTNVAYHFFIGADGTLKQTRCLFERSQHTSDDVKYDSIGIVLAGNFQHNEVTRPQAYTLQKLLQALKKQDMFSEVQGHCNNKATSCPGRNLHDYLQNQYGADECHKEEVTWVHETDPLPDVRHPEMIKATRWYSDTPVVSKLASFDIMFTRYYTPVQGQRRYFREGGYEADFVVNCQGSCFHTADGTKLDASMAGKVLACPPEFKHGTEIYIEDWGIATCHDRGGAIKGARLDLWSGVGDEGLDNIKLNRIPTGLNRVTIVSIPE